MQSAVRSRRRCGAEKCTAAIQYQLELWSAATAAPESGKLWAEDKIIWFMMGRYKVTAREVETMTGKENNMQTGGRLFYTGLRVQQV